MHQPPGAYPCTIGCRASQALNLTRFRAPLLQREEGKGRELRGKR